MIEFEPKYMLWTLKLRREKSEINVNCSCKSIVDPNAVELTDNFGETTNNKIYQ